jgi:hypothetical protein
LPPRSAAELSVASASDKDRGTSAARVLVGREGHGEFSVCICYSLGFTVADTRPLRKRVQRAQERECGEREQVRQRERREGAREGGREHSHALFRV